MYIIMIVHMSLPLLETISFVKVAYTLPGIVGIYSSPMMFSGMVRTVHIQQYMLSAQQNPPWFTKNLASATTDDIELRICIIDLPVPYSGKFSYGANFRIFRMLQPLYENKNGENLNMRNFSFVCDL